MKERNLPPPHFLVSVLIDAYAVRSSVPDRGLLLFTMGSLVVNESNSSKDRKNIWNNKILGRGDSVKGNIWRPKKFSSFFDHSKFFLMAWKVSYKHIYSQSNAAWLIYFKTAYEL